VLAWWVVNYVVYDLIIMLNYGYEAQTQTQTPNIMQHMDTGNNLSK